MKAGEVVKVVRAEEFSISQPLELAFDEGMRSKVVAAIADMAPDHIIWSRQEFNSAVDGKDYLRISARLLWCN